MTNLRRIVPACCLALALSSCTKQPPVSEPPAKPSPTADSGENSDAAQDLPEAELVLERAVEALGGYANINAIKSFYSEATMEVKGQNLKAAIKIWWQDGDFYMLSDMTGVGTSQVWKKGKTIWSDDPVLGRRQLEGKEAEQAASSATVALAAHWRNYFNTATTIGQRTVDGKRVIDVEFVGAHDNQMTLTFDAESGLPISSSVVQATPIGDVPVIVTFEDYRDVGGMMTSFRSVSSMSLFESEVTVTKFEIGEPVDPARFSPTP